MLNTHAQPPTSHAPTKRSAAAPPATRGWGGMAEEGAAAAAVERARRAAWTSATGATDAGRGWVARTTVEKARQASAPAIARAVGANADATGTPAEARVAEEAAAAAAGGRGCGRGERGAREDGRDRVLRGDATSDRGERGATAPAREHHRARRRDPTEGDVTDARGVERHAREDNPRTRGEPVTEARGRTLRRGSARPSLAAYHVAAVHP